MVAFNFKAQWAQLVTDGIKRQTVRASLRAEVGDTLQLYTGQRTKACRKLRADTPCVGVSRVVRDDGDHWGFFRFPGFVAHGEDVSMPPDRMALLDGFGTDVIALLDFFPPGFSGWLYRWDVPVHPGSAWEWFGVFPGDSVNGARWQAAGGARYTTRPADFQLPGAIGLMRGIPADWVEVV